MSTRPRDPGSTLGAYTIVRGLASGGMGAVFVARDRANREVALKLVHEGGSRTRGARFEVEAQAVARLRHPGIVAVHDFGRDERGQGYLVMGLVQGETLAQRLETQGPLEPRAAAGVARQLADALAYAHGQGVLHRDVKPDNVLLDANERAVLTDFGLAKVVDQSQHLTQTGELLGTPAYMPPEQIQGKRELIGPPSDVYGVGATLYALLTGNPPHQADSPYELLALTLNQVPSAPKSDPALDAITLKCLRKAPGDRYPTAGELAEDLDRYLSGAPVAARSTRGGLLRTSAAVGILALAAALAWIALAHTPPPAPLSPGAPAVSPTQSAAPVARTREVCALLQAGDPARALTTLRLLTALSVDEVEQVRGAADSALGDLCAKAPPRVRDVLEDLELLAHLQAQHPRAQPTPPCADAVPLLSARLEESASEQLGDQSVLRLMGALPASGLRPSDAAQLRVFEAIRFSDRPRHPDYLARAHRYLLVLVELEANISKNNYAQLMRTGEGWHPPAPRSPTEALLALRLLLADERRSKEHAPSVRRFYQSPHFAALSPRHRASVLLELATDLKTPQEQAKTLREAVRLAPEFAPGQAALARHLLLNARILFSAGHRREALELLSEACEHADRSLGESPDGTASSADLNTLETAVEAHALAGDAERVHSISALGTGHARSKLERVGERGLALRKRLGLE